MGTRQFEVVQLSCAYGFKIVKASSKTLISKDFVDNARRLAIH
jgi:hypothetical protein